MKINYIEGQTPLEEDELADLKLSHITNQEELNYWEFKNIRSAEEWAHKNIPDDFLSEVYIRKLHEKIFGDVWKWGGIYRKTRKNVGIDAAQIATEIKNLADSTKAWLKHKSYPPLELAIRFHHRVVFIHPFPNGNGRQGRLLTDVLVKKELSIPALTWGSGQSIEKEGSIRNQYVEALRTGDKGNFDPLLTFATS
jgi:Fic-DOC domain mobile mystery protein B